jgi:hypothetical protein
MRRWFGRKTWAAALAALAGGAGALALVHSAFPRPGRAPVPLSREGGKLGPAAQLRLEASSRGITADGEEAELVLTVLPGFDAADARVEFVLPRGWASLSGPAEQAADFIAGRESVFRMLVRVPAGGPRAAAARVRAGALTREVYVALEGALPRPWGRRDQDAGGNPLRVFPSGEGGKR